MNNACRNCKHFFIDGEGWEYPQYDFANCRKRSSMMYLKSFPFKNTTCKTYEESQSAKTRRERTELRAKTERCSLV